MNYIRDEKDERIECDTDIVEKAVDTLDAEKVVMNQDTVLRMHQAIAELPDRYRLPLELRMMDIAPAEIAKTLNLSPRTVYKQIERGCAMIRKEDGAENGVMKAAKVSLRLLLKFCFEQEAQERIESYLSPQELKELYPDMTALDQKVADGIDALQRRKTPTTQDRCVFQ